MCCLILATNVVHQELKLQIPENSLAADNLQSTQLSA